MARGFMYADGASEDVATARRPDLTKAQLVELAQSKNELVKEIIAGREDCPLGIMVTLTHDKATDVRAAVAGNPLASRTVMEHLADDKQSAVLEALVANPSLPVDMLEQLAMHRRADVRTLAAAKLDEVGSGSVQLQDTSTPELRDHIFDSRADATVVDISTGRAYTPMPSLAYDADATEPSARGTSAPMSDFRGAAVSSMIS